MNNFPLNLINLLVILLFSIDYCVNYNLKYLDLPENHLSQYFNKFPAISEKCKEDKLCKYSKFLNSEKYDEKACWGYEKNCSEREVKCPGNHTGYVETKEAQLDVFYSQADFGFVKQQIEEMTMMCDPLMLPDSSLECSKSLRFCRGRNIMMNFTELSDVPLR